MKMETDKVKMSARVSVYYYALRLPEGWVFLKNRVHSLNSYEILDVMIQFNIALKLIHECGYIYNNFKLNNIIISE